MMANQWVFGEFLCYISLYFSYYTSAASNLLICALTTSKMLLLKSPLTFGMISSKKAHMFCGVFWMMALVSPVLMVSIDWKDVHFSYTFYFCNYGFSSETWKGMGPPLVGAFIAVLPTLFVIITSVYLLIIARRVAAKGRNSLKWQGIITTLLTAVVYCFSLLPMFVSDLLVVSLGAEVKSKGDLITTSYRLALTFLYLNTISNFYIYSLTVDSFRNFVLSKCRLLFPRLFIPIAVTFRGMSKSAFYKYSKKLNELNIIKFHQCSNRRRSMRS